jgi:hypothetical protein
MQACYIAKSSATFCLNTMYQDQAAGEATCRRIGSHLATYTSAQEQSEVEQHFTNLVGAAAEHV